MAEEHYVCDPSLALQTIEWPNTSCKGICFEHKMVNNNILGKRTNRYLGQKCIIFCKQNWEIKFEYW